MIKINLLSPDLIKKEERSELIVVGYVLVAIGVVIGGMNFGAKYAGFKKLESRVNQSERELAKYETIQKQVEALQATRNILETKKSIINTLMQGRLVYVKFMEDMLEIMPNNLWFKNINTQIAPDLKISVTMDAEALDNYAIADFLSALSQSEIFSNAELGAITTTAGAKTPTSSFQVKYAYSRKIK